MIGPESMRLLKLNQETEMSSNKSSDVGHEQWDAHCSGCGFIIYDPWPQDRLIVLIGLEHTAIRVWGHTFRTTYTGTQMIDKLPYLTKEFPTSLWEIHRTTVDSRVHSQTFQFHNKKTRRLH